jgi:hypothetical protein
MDHSAATTLNPGELKSLRTSIKQPGDDATRVQKVNLNKESF